MVTAVLQSDHRSPPTCSTSGTRSVAVVCVVGCMYARSRRIGLACGCSRWIESTPTGYDTGDNCYVKSIEWFGPVATCLTTFI